MYKTRYLDGMSGMGGGGYSSMAAGAAQGTMGLGQILIAYDALKKLQKKPKDVYGESPEMRAARIKAEQNAQFGYTPEQKAAFFQNLAAQNNARYQRAIGMAGGNLAQAVQSGINYGNINALNNFAAQDADRKLRNQQYADSFARNIQALKNMQTQRNQQDRIMQEQALGAAINAGATNFGQSWNTFSGGTAQLSNPSSGGGQGQRNDAYKDEWERQLNSDQMSGNDTTWT